MRKLALAPAVLLLSFGAVAASQARPTPAPPMQPLPPMSLAGEPRISPGSDIERQASLRSRIGIEWAEGLFGSEDPEQRIRALTRLGEMATPQALELLGEALDPSEVARTAFERLAAIRAMAPHAGDSRVRRALVLAMSGPGSPEASDEQRERLVRETAAMALAESGSPAALRWLGRALRQPGPLADAAVNALVAYPPSDLGPLLSAPGSPTLALVLVLERLGDQRAVGPLRHLVTTGSSHVQARAAVALTRLGDLGTIGLAKRWTDPAQASSAHREAGAEILALTRSPGWPGAIESLLGDPAMRTSGLRLAADAAHPGLVAALARCLDAASAPEGARHLGLVAIARSGGHEAFRQLERYLGDEALRSAAAYAIALSPHDEATSVLERALARPATAALAARAAIVRRAALKREARGLRATLDKLLKSTAPVERAAAAWGLGTVEPARLVDLLRSKDGVVVAAAARALPGADATAFAQAAARLGREPDARLRHALALALIHDDATDQVPTSVLAQLVDSQGPAAPLAAYRLSSRRGAGVDEVQAALLPSPDALWRTHLALGMGLRREASVVAALEQAYGLEAEASVRRSLVIAMGLHTRQTPAGTLQHAMTLDPDTCTRQAAQLAAAGLLGPSAAKLERGHASVWVTVKDNRENIALPQVVVVTPNGLALPVTPDPDGVVSMVGLTAGPVEFRVWLPRMESAPRPEPG